tara:strand:+ start:1950 stop:2117 length:168 start_codon:yes stop_codon:yes gene_type:complete
MMDRIIFFQFVAKPTNFYTGCPVVFDFWVRQDKSKLTTVPLFDVSGFVDTPVGLN